MKKIRVFTIASVLVFMSYSTYAQNKWTAEFRPSLSFPTENFGNADIKTGFGFELTIAYRFAEHFDAYAGWGYNTFNFEDSDFDMDETGYTFGVQFIHPIGSSESWSYLLRAGAVYNHLELENNDGDLLDDSGHGLGWQFGVGLDYALGSNWHLRPTVRYRSLSRDLDIMQSQSTSVDLNKLSFGLGLSKRF